MAKALEEKLARCKKCGTKTVHQRTINKTGLIMLLIHICLIVMSAGVWLLILAVWLLLTKKVGGWSCLECRKSK